MINWIILAVTAVILGFAIRSIVKSTKSGGCAGCSHCSSCDTGEQSCAVDHKNA